MLLSDAISTRNVPLTRELISGVNIFKICEICIYNNDDRIFLTAHVPESYHGVLLYAVRRESVELINRLLLQMTDEQLEHMEPLIEAVKNGNPDVVQTLLYAPGIKYRIKYTTRYLQSLPNIRSMNNKQVKILKLIADHPNTDITQRAVFYISLHNCLYIEKLIYNGYTKEQLLNIAFSNSLSVECVLKSNKPFNFPIDIDLLITIVDHHPYYALSLIYESYTRKYINHETLSMLFKRQLYSNIEVFIDCGIQLKDYPEMFVKYISWLPDNVEINGMTGKTNIYEIIQYFIAQGVDINYGQSLVQCIKNKEQTYTKLLLENGADPTLDDHLAYRVANYSPYMDDIYILIEWYDQHNIKLPSVFSKCDDLDLCREDTRNILATLEPIIVPCLMHGNPTDGYISLDIHDLLIRFKQGDFRNPYDLKQVFDIHDLFTISNIINPLNDEEYEEYEYDEDKVIEYNQFMIDYQLEKEEFNQNIKALQELNSGLIKDLFIYLFEMGMYFRQWKGPGHEYPLSEEDSGLELNVGSLNELQLVKYIQDIHGKYIQTLNQLQDTNIYQSLPCVRIISGKLDFAETTIKDIYENTILHDNYCIRESSIIFVITGAYYLRVIYNYIIPGYNLGIKIDEIS